MSMGADTNKKKVAALILSRVKPNGESESLGESDGMKPTDSPLSEGERSAGEEIMEAVKGGDVEALVAAIKSLIELADGNEPVEPKSSFMG